LIKEAFDKNNANNLENLVDLCDGCGNCSYVCQARIDLKGSTLRAKVSINQAQ